MSNIERIKVENRDVNSAFRVIQSEVDSIIALRNNLDSSLSEALDLMQQAKGRVVLSGIGKSGHIARKIAASLASTGTPSFYVHPAEASHGDLGMITDDDVIIAISNSGESSELLDIINYAKRFNIKLISITKNKLSTLARASNVVLCIPDTEEACPLGLAPTSSTTTTLVLGDILTIGLIERKGFTPADFKSRHPGGKLGSILKRVSDLMHSGKEMPLLSEKAVMQDVILEISSKRLGCVGFVDDKGGLTGIITDGDLRRLLFVEVMHEQAHNIMTRNPVVCSKDMLVSEAIRVLNERKITNMFVVENNKPIGVIHIHDLLNCGTI